MEEARIFSKAVEAMAMYNLEPGEFQQGIAEYLEERFERSPLMHSYLAVNLTDASSCTSVDALYGINVPEAEQLSFDEQADEFLCEEVVEGCITGVLAGFGYEWEDRNFPPQLKAHLLLDKQFIDKYGFEVMEIAVNDIELGFLLDKPKSKITDSSDIFTLEKKYFDSLFSPEKLPKNSEIDAFYQWLNDNSILKGAEVMLTVEDTMEIDTDLSSGEVGEVIIDPEREIIGTVEEFSLTFREDDNCKIASLDVVLNVSEDIFFSSLGIERLSLPITSIQQSQISGGPIAN